MAINFMGSVYSTKMVELLGEIDENATELTTNGLLGILMMCGYYVFIFACIIGTTIALPRLRKYLRSKKPVVKMTTAQTLRIWLFNPAVLVLVFVIVLSFIGSIAMGA
jgi:uncharacterized membrane protein YidH (DUF202 family)